jgi:colanic acid/amylovoran biosynthesis glycosyltransferase
MASSSTNRGASSPPSPEPPGRLLVLTGDAGAPSETFIRRDIEALRLRGWRIEVLGLGLRPPPPPAAGAAAARLPPLLRRRARRHWRRPRQALAILRRAPLAALAAETARRADLVLAHFAWLTADVAAAAAAAADRPWVCAVHARDVFAQPPAALRRRLAAATRILACSDAAAAAVRQAGVPAGLVARVNHGIPLGEYRFRAAPRPPAQIAAAGRLVPKKGFDTLLTACARCLPHCPRLQLHLAGDGPERGRLARLARRLGLGNNVVFHGWLDAAAARELVAQSTILALPSRRLPDGDRDGIANVLLEAMALGTPVVTTTAGGAPEIIADDVNGLLLPADDPAALAGAVRALIADPPRRERLARAARATVEKNFDLARTAAALERELLAAAT